LAERDKREPPRGELDSSLSRLVPRRRAGKLGEGPSLLLPLRPVKLSLNMNGFYSVKTDRGELIRPSFCQNELSRVEYSIAA
jgi:hypothetical protein